LVIGDREDLDLVVRRYPLLRDLPGNAGIDRLRYLETGYVVWEFVSCRRCIELRPAVEELQNGPKK
jgi:hypothetical protein